MANKFTFTITAVDRATAVVKGINKSTAKMMQPFTNIGRSMQALKKQFNLNPAVRSIGLVANVAGKAAGALGGMVSPIAALGSIGTIAGVVAMSEALSRVGLQTTYLGKRTGLALTPIQRLRGAATAAGLDVSSMDQALVSLGDTLQDALYGRNQQALMLLTRLGISIKRDKNGVVDTAAALNSIADAIARIGNPQAQAKVAQILGLEDLLPLLQKGSSGIKAYADEAQRAGAVNDEAVKSNARLAESFNRLELASQGAKNAVSPWWNSHVMIPAVSNLASMINQTFSVRDEGNKVRNPFTQKAWEDSFGERMKRFAASAPNAKIPLGIRTNNPLNFRPGQRQAVFRSPAEGISAGIRNIVKNYQGLTLAAMIRKYSPPNAPGNSEASYQGYVSDVSAQTGIGPNQVPNLTDRASLVPLIQSFIRHENGQNPYSKEIVEQAAQKVLVEVSMKDVPPGTTVTARTPNNEPLPVNVAYSMPAIVGP